MATMFTNMAYGLKDAGIQFTNLFRGADNKKMTYAQ
jgi:hypothetical protein